MFLLFLGLMLTFVLVQIALSFANIDMKKQAVRFAFNIILILAVLPSIIFVYVLFGFHTYLTQGNMTTN